MAKIVLAALGIAVLAVVGAIAFWAYQNFRILNSGSAGVDNFKECVSQGYPILESYPRQCRTPAGKIFTEDIGNALEKTDLIVVSNPRPNQTVTSPLIIAGEARGVWFFEATFPVKIVDGNGNIIAQHYAQAKSDWMTENFVSFEAELNFVVPKSQKAILVLEKSNPSDLPEHYDELRIPIMLQESGRLVRLYYYDPNLDKDESGNIMCSRNGLVAVERAMPITQTPIQDAIKKLLAGELTNQDLQFGITTEYPLEGFTLQEAALRNGVLTLKFDDPQNKTVGGSCRVGILWFQIEATAKQFPEVKEVRFLPETIFQP